MAVKGKTNTFTGGYTKKVGLFEGQIVAINPNASEIEEITGREPSKEPEYLGEDRDGNDNVRLDFWVKDVNGDHVDKCTIFISDAPILTKDGSKTKFINTQGRVSYYIDEEKNLPEWFSAYDVWQAKQGEDNLYALLNAWLQIDVFNDKSAEMYVDLKKILRGNVKELRSFIGSEYDHTVLFNSIITTSTKEDDEGNETTVEYANLYNKDFLPGYKLKLFTLGKSLDKICQKYVDQLEYTKGFYILKPLQDYDPSMNVIASDEPLQEADAPDY